MASRDVLEVLEALEGSGINVWLNGGWGVDGLLGQQTRDHEDLDITIATSDRGRFEEVIHGMRFVVHRIDNDFNWVLIDKRNRLVDVHLVDFGRTVVDAWGKQMYGPNGLPFEVGSLEGTGTIEGRLAKCETAEFQVPATPGTNSKRTTIATSWRYVKTSRSRCPLSTSSVAFASRRACTDKSGTLRSSSIR